jgi:sterol desaturase/sphingolipid hydroxylase (fatty acid hydroxylase superfamily)
MDPLTYVYSYVFFPALPVIATVQTTLTGILPVVSVAFAAQLLFPAVRRRPKILSYEMWLDVVYLLQTQLMYMTVLGVAVGTTAWWLKEHTPVLFPGLSEWPLWLQVVLARWMYDFVVYWRHRLEHQLFFLWPIHAVHHTTKKVDVLTTTRLHFLELMLGGVLNMWMTARFGISAHAAGIGFMLYLNHNYYVHTNVKIVYPGFLRYVFVSPFMHRWHHAREDQARDKNFGVVFAWNDWLFGTALHPDREPSEYGIDYPEGEVAPDSYIAHQLYPLKVLLVRLKKRLMEVTEPLVDTLHRNQDGFTGHGIPRRTAGRCVGHASTYSCPRLPATDEPVA